MQISTGWRYAVAFIVSLSYGHFVQANHQDGAGEIKVKVKKTVHELTSSRRQTKKLNHQEIAHLDYNQKVYGQGDSHHFPLLLPRPDKFCHKLVEYGAPLECWVAEGDCNSLKLLKQLKYFDDCHQRFQSSKRGPDCDKDCWAIDNVCAYRPETANTSQFLVFVWNIHNDDSVNGVHCIQAVGGCGAVKFIHIAEENMAGQLVLSNKCEMQVSMIRSILVIPGEGFKFADVCVQSTDKIYDGRLPIIELSQHFTREVEYTEMVRYAKCSGGSPVCNLSSSTANGMCTTPSCKTMQQPNGLSVHFPPAPVTEQAAVTEPSPPSLRDRP